MAVSYTCTDQVLCCVVLCCAVHKQWLTVCVTTAIQFQHLPSPVSPTVNTNRTPYMGLTHVSILVPPFLQTASCISSFVIRVSRIRISTVSQEAVNQTNKNFAVRACAVPIVAIDSERIR